ncbi:MAG TPA: hypothetical protein DIU18_01735, partial [Gemmatimonadetes bacterium]|nr:hypothetical protein [Gemmatimonadota bacterium]
MPKVAFKSLPDDARLWVFGVERALTADEQAVLLTSVDRFLEDWAAHGSPLTGARDLLEERFLMVGVDEASVPPSGCSIDAMVGVLRSFEETMGVGLVGHGPVFYRTSSGDVTSVARSDFRRLAEEGRGGPATAVFDTTLTRVGRLRHG